MFLFFRGRKPGSGRKNGGTSSKGKDKKLSETESDQEVGGDLHHELSAVMLHGCLFGLTVGFLCRRQDDSEDSETDGDEEDGSQSSTNRQAAAAFHR